MVYLSYIHSLISKVMLHFKVYFSFTCSLVDIYYFVKDIYALGNLGNNDYTLERHMTLNVDLI